MRTITGVLKLAAVTTACSSASSRSLLSGVVKNPTRPTHRRSMRLRAPESQQQVVEVVEAVPNLPAAPDFTLPAANRDSTEISLSQFQGDKPVVLVFYRAYW